MRVLFTDSFGNVCTAEAYATWYKQGSEFASVFDPSAEEWHVITLASKPCYQHNLLIEVSMSPLACDETGWPMLPKVDRVWRE